MEYSFSSIEHCLLTNKDIDDSFALGFKEGEHGGKVENLNKASGLFDFEWENAELYKIRDFLRSTNLPAWHPPKKTGFFRHLVVRKSFDTNSFLINLVTSSEGLSNFDKNAFVDFVVSLLEIELLEFNTPLMTIMQIDQKLKMGNAFSFLGIRLLLKR